MNTMMPRIDWVGENIGTMKRYRLISALVPILLAFLGTSAWADQEGGVWMPPGASTYTEDVDLLYKGIFWVTTAFFVLVEGLLVVFCILYRRRPGHRPAYTHGNNKAELVWTIVPAVMLVGLAVWQIPTWAAIKQEFPEPGPGVTEIQIIGQQFKWNYRYPGTKKALETENDVNTMGAMHVPAGDKVLIHLRSADVIHSYFIPHMRVKQDAVPGLRQRIWFQPNRYWLVKLKNDDGSPVTLTAEGKKWDGSPRMVQPRVWVNIPLDENGKPTGDPDAPFKQGGEYYEKRIAVSPADYLEFEGFYDVPKPGGTPKKVRVLHQGKVTAGQEWASCDYAIAIFEVACAELCGNEHFTMRGFLYVEPRVSYEAWLESFADFDEAPRPVWKHWVD